MARVLLASPYFAPKIGGVERYAHQLAVGLRDRHDHEVTVVTTGDTRRPGWRHQDGLRVLDLPVAVTVSATPFHPRWVHDVRRLLAQHRFDVVNTHAPVPGLADVVLSQRGAVPAVATYHSGSMRKQRLPVDLAVGAYERVVLPALLRRAESVVTTFPGRSVAGVPTRFIPPGVDPRVFHPSDGVRRERALVLYVGRIERASSWKGIGTLLHAFVDVSRSAAGARLRLVGGGDAVDDHRALARRLGIADRVDFVGPLPAESVADEYRRATVTVLPSETEAEAFGMVLIESMACGTPVVASAVGGMPDVLGATGGGLLAEPGDPHSLAATLTGLLHEPRLQADLAEQGAKAVAARFTWDAAVDAHHELIGGLVQRARPRTRGART